MSSITIKDIAEQLNLSVSTVSKALHDYPDVGVKTKEKVLALANKLDYQPNILAQSLRRKNSKIIGVIVPDICYHFFSAAISGIEKVAYDSGYILMLSQTNESVEREIINTRSLISNRVAGLLASISQTTKDVEHFRVLQRRQSPVVFFDRMHQDIKASRVLSNDYQGAFSAVEYLIRTGRKRIAHFSGPLTLNIGQARLKGYKDALLKYEYPIEDDLIYEGGFNVEDGIKGMNWLINQETQLPDAIFTANDEAALGVYEVVKTRGLKIPEDIAVIGFSNDPVSALLDPPLTTIEQSAFEIGKTAATILLEEISSINNGNDQQNFTPRIDHFDTRLIVRQST